MTFGKLSSTPTPAIDSRNHQHGRWAAATLGSASRSLREAYFTRACREAPATTAQPRLGRLRLRQHDVRLVENVKVPCG